MIATCSTPNGLLNLFEDEHAESEMSVSLRAGACMHACMRGPCRVSLCVQACMRGPCRVSLCVHACMRGPGHDKVTVRVGKYQCD